MCQIEGCCQIQFNASMSPQFGLRKLVCQEFAPLLGKKLGLAAAIPFEGLRRKRKESA